MKTIIALIIALAPGAAFAQQAILQGNNWTVGDSLKYSGSSSANPVVSDSGLPLGTPPTYTVATLPTCSSSTKGNLYVVSDASSPTYGATLTGGSTTEALALCDGSNWKSH